MNLHDLAEQAETGAVARGFDPCTWENMPGKIAFVFTELEEACCAANAHRFVMDAVIEELADIALRTMAIMHGVYGREWQERSTDLAVDSGLFAPLECSLRSVTKYLSNAIGYWRDDDKVDAGICLELALASLIMFAKSIGYDLTISIVRKLEKNAYRPKLHGHIRTLG